MEKYLEEYKLLSLIMTLRCVLHEAEQEKCGGDWTSFLQAYYYYILPDYSYTIKVYTSMWLCL